MSTKQQSKAKIQKKVELKPKKNVIDNKKQQNKKPVDSKKQTKIVSTTPKKTKQVATKKNSKAKHVAKPSPKVQKKIKKTPPKKGTIPKPSTKKDPLIVPRPRNYSIGNAIQPPRNLYKYVKWPKYVRIQRHKRILLKRLKVPVALDIIMNRTLGQKDARTLFRMLHKYRTEEKTVTKRRRVLLAKKLVALQKAGKKGTKAEKEKNHAAAKKAKAMIKKSSKKNAVVAGLNQVTKLIEKGKAKLVVIAHDVDPIELVVFLPYLCRRKGIPFCIVRCQARLGRLVHRKTATCIAVRDVDKSDKKEFLELTEMIKTAYNNNPDMFKPHVAKKKSKSKKRETKLVAPEQSA